MTATTEDWSLVNLVHSEPAPRAVSQRRTILNAILVAAVENGGLVHASWVRPYIEEGSVDEHLIGNVTSHLARRGILVKTGRYLPSGDVRNRNQSRDLPVRKVADWERLADAVEAVA